MKNRVLIIIGPTASGKSALAIKLAKKLKGEIVSADSRQVYKGLDVGTGKVTKKEMRGIPHHLLDVVNAKTKKIFSASDYKIIASEAIDKINTRKKLPIIVGGTGFYIDTLIGQTSLPEVPPNKKLRQKLERKTVSNLFKILKKKDPRRAKTIDPKNKVRLVRALEIIEALGKVPIYTPTSPNWNFVFIGLTLPQSKLDQKIYTRLLKRLPNIIKEVKKLRKQGLSWKRLYNLGLEYRYTALYLQNKITKEEMIGKLYTEIKKYSKRQITWFKRNKQIKWFDPKDYKSILNYAVSTTQLLSAVQKPK